MAFCTECGKELTNEDLFCTNCGKSVPKDQVNNAETNHEQHHPEASSVRPPGDRTTSRQKKKQAAVATKAKKPMSKQTKIFLITGAIIAVLALGTHKWLESHFNPLKNLEAMDDAIIEDDMESFLHFIDFNEKATLDNQLYFDYIKDYEWESNIRDQYLSIIEDEEESDHRLHENIVTSNGDVLYKVKYDKKFGLYPTYTLQAIPVKLRAYSNLEKTVVTFDQQEINLDYPEEFLQVGLVYPGTYDISAKVDGEFGEIVYADTVEVGPSDQEVFLDFSVGYIRIQSATNDRDAILYINDQKTGYTLHETDPIGPFPVDMKVKIHAEGTDEDGNTVLSETTEYDSVHGIETVYVQFKQVETVTATVEDEEEEKEKVEDKSTQEKQDQDTEESSEHFDEAGEFVLTFRDAYEDAVNYVDYSMIEPYLKENSHAAKELKKFIHDMDGGNYVYDFEENTILDVKNDGENSFVVQTNEKFTFTDNDGQKYKYNRMKSYYVIETDGSFSIVKIEYDDTKKNNVN